MADSFEGRGRSTLWALLKHEPETFRDLAVNYMGVHEGNRFCRRRKYTDADPDWLAGRIVAGIRSGTRDEGKPFVKRMH